MTIAEIVFEVGFQRGSWGIQRGSFLHMNRSFLTIVPLVAILCNSQAAKRPNILFAISDDQSYVHTSAMGYKAIHTPGFDRVAKSGVMFKNAFAPSPGCSPTRAAFLTGRHTWQIEQAGTHASSFPEKYVVFSDLLEKAGYFVGVTGKAWGPGNFKISGRKRNPAGPSYTKHKAKPPFKGISSNDYASNFEDFLEARPDDQPFYFWYGASEPHRSFEKGAGLKSGKRLEDIVVPPFLPDTREIRSDIADYLVEIEHFDKHLVRMLNALEKAGELENTLVIVTSDNGMAFPRAKANLYDYGFHMPLAISWGAEVPGGRVVEDVVGFVDITATILDAAQVTFPKDRPALAGRSIVDLLKKKGSGRLDPSRKYVYAGRERHSSSRWNNNTYPQRAIRSQDYLLIRNFHPERWPAGTPQKFEANGELGPEHGGYHDIDACPSLSFLIANRDHPEIGKYFHWAVDHRPEWEMFDTNKDPGCLVNLAEDPAHKKEFKKLSRQLNKYLKESGDPRMNGNGDIWEKYKRYSRIRSFPEPEWAKGNR